MTTVNGFFSSREGATRAVRELRVSGIHPDRISVLTPDARDAAPDDSATGGDGHRPVGEVADAILGISSGGSGGTGLDAAAVRLAVPGVGPVIGIGPAAGTVLGMIGGAKTGREAGELPLIRYALCRGRTVVLIAARDEEEADTASDVFAQLGTGVATRQ